MNNYTSLKQHYEKCYRLHGDSHQGVDWPNQNDAYRRYQVMLDGVGVEGSLLDFGCGLSHFYQFLLEKGTGQKIKYAGADISSIFVEASQKKFPTNDYYCLDILQKNSLPNFDYVVANGVFTEKVGMSHQEMESFTFQMLKQLWKVTDHRLVVNFMSKHVDWERDDLFHLPLDVLINFVTFTLNTRNFIIRNDYGLYEYTVYLNKR